VGIPKRISYLLDASHKIVAVYQNFFGAEEHIRAMLEKLKK
jgi:peroxiredoxin Q/BCP